MTSRGTKSVVVSVASSAALIVILAGLSIVVPMSGNAEHLSAHLALGVPLLLLLALALMRWPPPRPELSSRLARATLLAGLAVAGLGLLIEAVGALGYSEDRSERANALASLHDVGVAVWPLGFVLVMVGTIMSVAVSLAARRGAAGSRIVKTGAVVAIIAVTAFIVGAFVFGY